MFNLYPAILLNSLISSRRSERMSAIQSSTGLPIDPLCCCCWTHLELSVGNHQSGLEKSLPRLPFIFRLGVRKCQVIAPFFFGVCYKSNSRCTALLVLQFWNPKPAYLHLTIFKNFTLVLPCVIFRWGSGRDEPTPACLPRSCGPTHVFHLTSRWDFVLASLLFHFYYFVYFYFLLSTYCLVISVLEISMLSLVHYILSDIRSPNLVWLEC